VHFHACGWRSRHARRRSYRLGADREALKKIRYKGDVVIESFTTDVKVIARAAAIWRKMEPKRDDIAVKGLANLKVLRAEVSPIRGTASKNRV